MGKTECLYHLEDDLKQALFAYLINPVSTLNKMSVGFIFIQKFLVNFTNDYKEMASTIELNMGFLR